jgi:hypothetical protein
LIQRGATRRLSVADNLRQVGVGGILGAMREGFRSSFAPAAVSNRSAYLIERGVAAPDLDGRLEPIPAGAAAALVGLHDFLRSLPALSERRAGLQSARRRSDREILARFNRHWTSPAGSPHQTEHDELQRTLIEALAIAELAEAKS